MGGWPDGPLELDSVSGSDGCMGATWCRALVANDVYTTIGIWSHIASILIVRGPADDGWRRIFVLVG